MTNIIKEKRINQITTFLKSLKIKSKRFSDILKTKNIFVIQNFNQALMVSLPTRAWSIFFDIHLFNS